MDVHCRCGEMGHVDAEFAYFYRCKACGVAFAVGQTVRLYAIDTAHESDVMTIDPVTDTSKGDD